MNKTNRREKGTGSVEKKGHHFYLKIRIGGRTKSTLLLGKDDHPVTTRKEAEAAAALLRPVLRAAQKEEIALHVASAKKLRKEHSISVSQIWDVYLRQYTRPDSQASTLTGYNVALRDFTGWLSEAHPEIQQVNRITEDEAGEYVSYLWNVRKVSGRTFNGYRKALKLIFTHILKPAGMETNPFASINGKPLDTQSRWAFTEEQVQQIFSGFQTGFFYETEVTRFGAGRKHTRVKCMQRYEPMFKDEMRVLLMLCCWTGCRGQDGCLMRWSNIDMEHNTITYIPRKTARKTNNREVTLPIHPDLAAALSEAQSFRERNRKKEDFIIPSVAARYKSNPSCVQKDVQKIIRCATGLAITDADRDEHRIYRANRYSLHSFRHTFVSFCANAGVPLDVVATIVGHSSSSMTRHYAHISDDAKKNAINTLPSLSAPKHGEELRRQLVEKLQSLSDEQLKTLLKQIC